jgi:hypothetical protein
MAIANKTVTIVANTAGAEMLTLVKQPDGTWVLQGKMRISLSDGDTLEGYVSFPIVAAGQITATTALENAALRAWRLAKGVET